MRNNAKPFVPGQHSGSPLPPRPPPNQNRHGQSQQPDGSSSNSSGASHGQYSYNAPQNPKYGSSQQSQFNRSQLHQNSQQQRPSHFAHPSHQQQKPLTRQEQSRATGSYYYDKKDLAQFVFELKQATETAKVEATFGELPDGNPMLSSHQFQKISAAFECMAMLQLPLRQPSWCKEVSAAILIIGLIPSPWLSVSDFANISRFITRASVEKQLSISTDELLGVFKLLLGFLQRRGKGCREDVHISSGKSGESGSATKQSGAQVMHEVMRGMAQLLLIRNDRLMRYRLETLEVLLAYCTPREADLESRYAAIDAIGNVLAVKADADALLPPYAGRSAGQHAAEMQILDNVEIDAEAVVVLHESGALINGSLDESARRAVYKRVRSEALMATHDRCLQCLVDNLKAATNMLTEAAGGESLQLPSKLLVSCLRSLAQSIGAALPYAAVIAAPQTFPLAHPLAPTYNLPNFHTHTQSLIQSVYTIFDRILPSVRSLGGDIPTAATLTSKEQSSSSRRSSCAMSQALVAETKLWTHALKLLSILASFNPGAFLSNWPLFLVDSLSTDAQLQECVVKLHATREALPGTTVKTASGWVMIPVDPVLKLEAIQLPQCRSTIFSAACWAHQPSVRAAAVQCIKSMIKGLPLQRWFKAMRTSMRQTSASNKSASAEIDAAKPSASVKAGAKKIVSRSGFLGDKITATVIKIFRFTVLLLTVERDEAVVSELLGTASALVADMPLAVVHGSPRVGALEDLAVLLFRQAMIIASERTANTQGLNTAPAGRVSPVGTKSAAANRTSPEPDSKAEKTPPSTRVGDANVHALHWLSDICKNMPPLLSFQTALQLPAYKAGSAPPFDIRTATGSTLGADLVSISSAPAKTYALQDKEAALEKQSFVRVMGQICLVAANDTSPHVQVSNAYHNSCRTLQHMLVQSYSSLYTCDQAWLRVLIDACDASAVPALRLLSCKIVCSLLTLICSSSPSKIPQPTEDGTLEDDARNLDSISTMNDTDSYWPGSNVDDLAEGEAVLSLVGGHSLVETTIKLLKACCDSDHQIRGQAVAAFGQYSAYHWKSLRRSHSFLSVRKDMSPDVTGVDTSVRAAVLQCLIVACGDHVGTVRTAAQKSLGEAIVTGGLVVCGSGYDAPRKIFIIEGTNAVKERQAQAQQVQAEALAKAMAQAQAQAIAQAQTPAQRVAQITAQQNSKIPAPAESTIKDVRTVQRRSHQIDKSIKHEIPIPSQRQGPLNETNMRPGDMCINSVDSGQYVDIIMAVLQCLQDGCADSKLAVRLQATWAMGNLLLLVLPQRQKETFSPFSASFAIASVSFAVPAPSTEWTSDKMWFNLCDICMCLLEDSDKLLASTVRCLGFLAAGLSPWDGTHFSHLSAVVTALIQKVLLSGLTTQQDRDQYLKQSIQEHPHKLVFSVCQSLGFVGWVLVNRGDKDAGGVTPGVTECIDNVRAVQAAMLRYGRVKVQLQACKALISLTHNDDTSTPTEKRVSPNTANFLAGNFSSSEPRHSFFPNINENSEVNSSFAFSANVSAIDGGLLNDSVLALGRRGPEGMNRDHTRPDSLVRALEAALVTTASLSVPLPPVAILSTPLITNLSTIIGGKLPIVAGVRGKPPTFPKSEESPAVAAASAAASSKGVLPTSIPNIIVVSNINAAIMPAVRTSSLQRALLVLIWVMLRRVIATYVQSELDDGAPVWLGADSGSQKSEDRVSRDAVTQILLYHADALGEWLESMLGDSSPLNAEELSMTAPPLASTAPPLSLLTDATPRSVVPLIAECFLHIMQTDYLEESQGRSFASDGSSLPSTTTAVAHLTSATATKFAWLSSGGLSSSAKKSSHANASSFPPSQQQDGASVGTLQDEDEEL